MPEAEVEGPREPTRKTELHTFLIADVRGYTTYTREQGDEAAAALAERFAEIVRAVVTPRDGLLLELRGDEALVVFASARNALRAAIELQERFQAEAFPRGVGIGLDAGEALPVGDGFRGGALNLAARLCAQAGPGQVLASETVIHLAARVEGIAYVDARTMRLKGYDQPVRMVDVVSADRVPRGIGHRARRRASQIRSHGRAVLLGAGGLVGAVVVMLGLIATGILGGGGGSPSPSATASGPTGSSAASTPTSSPVVAGPGSAVLTVAMSSDPFLPMDPALADSRSPRQQIFNVTCVRLLAYPDTAGPEAATLQPEAAVALPDISADGLTWTFHVRAGFGFSPPSTEQLSAASFRHAIERSLAPALGERATGMQFLGDVVGAAAFHQGQADHVDGITADGDTLTIRLEATAADLPARLALPYFCPVPLDTPSVADGVSDPIAMAGPYYIAEQAPGVRLVLMRNPNYGGARGGAFDSVVYRTGVADDLAIDMADRGEVDYVISSDAPALLPGGSLETRWGAGSAAAEQGRQRHYVTPLLATDYLVLDARDPLLAIKEVRQAIGHALDRPTLAGPFGELPYADLLPIQSAGPLDYATFPITGPNLSMARDLMAGRSGRLTMAILPDCDYCRTFATTLQANLEAIGITLDIKEFDDPIAASGAPGNSLEIVNGFATMEYLDTATFLRSAVDPDRGGTPAGWLDPGIVASVRDLAGLTGAERAAAAAALARRLVDEDARLIPFAVGAFAGQYFSERIGCQVHQPAIPLMDLVALCIKR
jgi:peptide/nickel transport system substrate-binding protein